MSQADWLEKDFYAVLGVQKGASEEEIRKAYRQLARENHPDANPEDPRAEERFKSVSEAYGILSDEAKRREYDQIRQLAGSGGLGGGFGRFPGAGGFGGGASSADLNDILGSLFGDGVRAPGTPVGRRGAVGPRKGADLSAEVTLSFEDALVGVTVTLRLRGSAVCSTCRGVGARPGTMPERCTRCGGAGVVNENQGLFSFSQPCPQCAGRGEVITEPCPTCQGSGVEERARTVRARVPAGVTDGQSVRLPGKGEPGRAGGKPGDLLVRVNVSEHPALRRSGDNLAMTVPITFAEAALGAKVAVPTLDGVVTLKIPAGTDSGRTFRVRGRGAPRAGGGGQGDLLVTVQVAVPQKLSRTQKKLLEDFAAMDDSDVRAHLQTILAGQAEA